MGVKAPASALILERSSGGKVEVRVTVQLRRGLRRNPGVILKFN